MECGLRLSAGLVDGVLLCFSSLTSFCMFPSFPVLGITNYISILSLLEQMVINNGMPEAANASFSTVIEAQKPQSRMGKPLLACRRPSSHGKERPSLDLWEGTSTSHVSICHLLTGAASN